MDAALEYATEVAVREGCGLHLLHVLHHVAEGPEMVLVDIVDLEHAARGILGAAGDRARALLPQDLPVTTQLVWGGPVPSIVSASEECRMVVLQRRPLARVLRVVTRSTSSGVAAHAHVPVVMAMAMELVLFSFVGLASARCRKDRLASARSWASTCAARDARRARRGCPDVSRRRAADANSKREPYPAALRACCTTAAAIHADEEPWSQLRATDKQSLSRQLAMSKTAKDVTARNREARSRETPEPESQQ